MLGGGEGLEVQDGGRGRKVYEGWFRDVDRGACTTVFLLFSLLFCLCLFLAIDGTGMYIYIVHQLSILRVSTRGILKILSLNPAPPTAPCHAFPDTLVFRKAIYLVSHLYTLLGKLLNDSKSPMRQCEAAYSTSGFPA